MSMVRYRAATLALTALIVLAGCTASDQGAGSRPSTVSGGGGGGAISAGPSPGSAPTTPASPSPSPTRSPRPSPTQPRTTPPATPSRAGPHGPYGSMSVTGSSAVALTFDDGPDASTGQILDLLKRYGIHATFCIIGSNIAGHTAMIKRIVNEGHTLCNHTWTHDEQLRTRTPAQIANELRRTDDAIHAVVPGARIEYFRNPGGNFSPQTISIAASMGMKSLYWSVDPRDWDRPGTQAIINNVMTHTRRGSIVLMHDGGGDRSETVAALRTILPGLKKKYSLIPLPVSGPPSG
jgi:peptidoglycan/xylan/chitin deacetylase (PgdA/CDA1 family)